MNYFLGLFTPHTWLGFRANGSVVLGFPSSAIARTRGLQPGDIVIGYLAKISRWNGVFRISGPMFKDNTPLFCVGKDRYVLRFPVDPLVALDPPTAIPIDVHWDKLNRTKAIVRGSIGWAAKAGIMSSLNRFDAADGKLLMGALIEQGKTMKVYDLTRGEEQTLERESAKRTREIQEESTLRKRQAER